jgi:uncharacterized tellurite resistance protein B-like protein
MVFIEQISYHHFGKDFELFSLNSYIMHCLERLHFAIGELAYAVARADGTVQKEERNRFHEIVESELRNKDYAFDISEIIFQIMDKDQMDTETSYKWAMDEIRVNSHYLSPELKGKFIMVMEKVSAAFPPVTKEEHELMERFRKDIAPIKGDPVYYKSTPA